MTSKVRFKDANEACADFSFGDAYGCHVGRKPRPHGEADSTAQVPADSQQQLSDVGGRVLKVTPATPDCDHLRDHEQELPIGAQSSPAP